MIISIRLQLTKQTTKDKFENCKDYIKQYQFIVANSFKTG